MSSVELEKGVSCKREVRITTDSIMESTLDIWGVKSMFFPEINQYEIYKCFILKFEFSFAGFINPKVDLFHYTLKYIAYCDKVDEINVNNIREYFENSMILDKHAGIELIKKVIYENGNWFLKG